MRSSSNKQIHLKYQDRNCVASTITTLKNEEVADAKYGSNRKAHPSLRQQSNHYEGGQIRCFSLDDDEEDNDRMMKRLLSLSTSAEQLFRVRTQMKTERSQRSSS